MAKKPAKPSSESPGTQFIVDLGEVHLTDAEVDSVQNQITKLALELARKKDVAAKKAPKEPYVKILHVKTTHVRSIRQ